MIPVNPAEADGGTLANAALKKKKVETTCVREGDSGD